MRSRRRVQAGGPVLDGAVVSITYSFDSDSVFMRSFLGSNHPLRPRERRHKFGDGRIGLLEKDGRGQRGAWRIDNVRLYW